MTMFNRIDNNGLLLTFGKRFGLFACIFLFCFIACAFIVGIVTHISGGTSVAVMRIMTVVQDVVMFILPVIATTLLITRRPDEFLSIDRCPRFNPVMLTLATVLVSMPAMNLLVYWNESLSFPESLRGLEEWMRMSEETASAAIKMLLGGTSIIDLVLSVLIVGVLAGLSEELFFRGMLQKLFVTRPMNIHFAIWATAFVFSAIHMQFYGFFPRLLLGAFFGYLVWWSGNLWLPVIAHTFNNTLVVVTQWLSERGILPSDMSEIGTTMSVIDVTMVVVSVIATVVVMRVLRRAVRKGA